MTPFDFINAISQSKENLIVDSLTEKEYVPFVVNKGLSYFPDTVLYANEMNRLHLLDNKSQFCYLLNSLRPRKRFSKWFKSELEEDVKLISEAYGYSHAKARQVASLFTPDQLNIMREKLQKGGIKTKEKKNVN
jgi:hypothetical protein